MMEIVLSALYSIVIEALILYPGALILKSVTGAKESIQDLAEDKIIKSGLTGLAFWAIVIFVIVQLSQNT